MIIIDRALSARAEAKKPLRVALVGAGFMGRGIAHQIIKSSPGIELVAIANRRLSTAQRAYAEADVRDTVTVETISKLESAIRRGAHAVTEDATLLCQAQGIDAIIDATGAVEFGTCVALHAINHGKHLILLNAQLAGTVGPILNVHAQRAGVRLSMADGDQPALQLNLWRYVKSLGFTPLLCGNVKGLLDPYRTPTTQAEFAARWDQKPHMVTSFADGSEISFEQAVVANATGMQVATRGMLGYRFEGHIDDMVGMYDVNMLRELGGVVDYVVGAKPAGAVFVFATHDDPKQQFYLDLYKLGKGPLYSFYVPYHLCHFELPLSVARVLLFEDVAAVSRGAPRVSVVATAKTDLQVGSTLDGIGGYATYGQCENWEIVRREKLLPIGVAEDCLLKRRVSKDQVLSYEDVEVPKGRQVDRLLAEQETYFDTNERR